MGATTAAVTDDRALSDTGEPWAVNNGGAEGWIAAGIGRDVLAVNAVPNVGANDTDVEGETANGILGEGISNTPYAVRVCP
jgi:hypothetical protein